MIRTMAALALTLLFVPSLFAQMPEGQQMPDSQKAMPDCATMMKEHETMQKHLTEMDAKLQTLVDEMNKEKGSAKIDRVAAVVNELVAQHAMMQKEMAEMHPKMMAHMMEHLRSGIMKGMADSMTDCPMMKSGEKPTTEHQH